MTGTSPFQVGRSVLAVLAIALWVFVIGRLLIVPLYYVEFHIFMSPEFAAGFWQSAVNRYTLISYATEVLSISAESALLSLRDVSVLYIVAGLPIVLMQLSRRWVSQ